MGWLIEFVIEGLWIGFADRMSRGRPWWVWILWWLLPVLVVAALFGLAWLLL